MCKSGKYIYYIRPQTKKNPGIVRYNPKTGKKKLIVPNEIDGHKTGIFFENLEVKGKYIYCAWNIYDPEDTDYLYGCRAIYRITKDGKDKKLLAYGDNMVIKGNRIHYNKLKVIKIKGVKYTYYRQKRYSMKLDGSDKKREKVIQESGRATERITEFEILFPVITKKYEYYVENENVLYRKNKKNERIKEIARFSKNSKINSYVVSKDYMSVTVYNSKNKKKYVYLMKTNGEDKVVLEKWKE